MRQASVIIPSRNAANLSACVKAIRASGETCRIIVVDDGINWDAATGVEHVMMVKGVKPFVFARNVNIGIHAAGDDDVILMNDDALVSGAGFTQLRHWNEVYGVSAGGNYGMFGAISNSVGNQRQMRQSANPGFGRLIEEPRMLCFICVLIPRETINRVGLLDERFTGYGMDDDDYSFRVRAADLKLGICDGCFVEHRTLESSYRGKGGRGGDFTGNLKLFIEKWGHDNRGLGREQSPYKSLFPLP